MATFTLTAGVDTVAGGAADDTVNATAATLSSVDRLDGGSGTDTLALFGAGTFDLSALAQFANFEKVELADVSGGDAKLTLRNGADYIVRIDTNGRASVNLADGAVTLNEVNSFGGVTNFSTGAATVAFSQQSGGQFNLSTGSASISVNPGGILRSTTLNLSTGNTSIHFDAAQEATGNTILLSTGNADIHFGSTSQGNRVYVREAADLHAGLVLDASTAPPGSNSLEIGFNNAVVDLSPVALSGAWTLFLNTNTTIAVDNSLLTHFPQIVFGHITTSAAALDLTHVAVSVSTIATTNSGGTTFTVDSVNEGLNITGGSGNDTIVLQGGSFTSAQRTAIFGQNFIETITDASGTYTLVSLTLAPDVKNLVMQGTDDLQGYGNGLGNALYGNSGNNILNGGADADLMVGGAGDDAYFVDNVADAVFEKPGEGTDTVYATAHFRLSDNVENLILQGSADLQGYGNALSNLLYGNAGNNILNGDAGADAMIGGAGNDAYFVDNFADAVFEKAGEGNDTVYATAHFRLSDDVENLILQGTADLQGYGNGLGNILYGNGGNNLLNGEAGADIMAGGPGDDAYFVDNFADAVFENPGEGNDTVYSTADFRLLDNVETLILQGGTDLQGYGNSLANTIYGNAGNNVINGGGGPDMLTGRAGNDAFVFDVGQADGDTVVDFAGNGAAAGDWLVFVGYGPGATFTNIDTTHWQVNYNGGSSHEIITFANGASIDASDVVFM
jgi:Ca2+-binding RTX toxin-like protein